MADEAPCTPLHPESMDATCSDVREILAPMSFHTCFHMVHGGVFKSSQRKQGRTTESQSHFQFHFLQRLGASFEPSNTHDAHFSCASARRRGRLRVSEAGGGATTPSTPDGGLDRQHCGCTRAQASWQAIFGHGTSQVEHAADVARAWRGDDDHASCWSGE